jgi:hypothetical protein
MPFGSGLLVTFRPERPGPDTVSLVIKTVPKRQGGLGLVAALAAGLVLTAVLGSYSADFRAYAPRLVIQFLGFAALVGLGYKLLVGSVVRKASGTVSFFSPTRTLSQQGLRALFPWTERELPREAVVVLDTVRVLSPTARSKDPARSPTVHWRLWCMAPEGKEAHGVNPTHGTFHSPDAAPMPPGAVLLGSALENPIFRRLAEMLVEDAGCTAYDATGAQVDRIDTRPSLRTVTIAAQTTYVIPMRSWPIRIVLTMVAVVVAGLVSVLTLNPYLFAYLVALTLIFVSTRQVLVCDAAGLHLHYSYFFGLWRRGDHRRRWDDITTAQIDHAPNGALVLAVRCADGDDWKIMLPSHEVGRRLEEEIRRPPLRRDEAPR